MYELPEKMNSRFKLYLNILPILQDIAIYTLFVGGAIFLLWSIVTILLHQPKESSSNLQWSEAGIQRQRLSFLNEKEIAANKTREMDLYYSSLLSPQNEEVTSIVFEDRLTPQETV